MKRLRPIGDRSRHRECRGPGEVRHHAGEYRWENLRQRYSTAAKAQDHESFHNRPWRERSRRLAAIRSTFGDIRVKTPERGCVRRQMTLSPACEGSMPGCEKMVIGSMDRDLARASGHLDLVTVNGPVVAGALKPDLAAHGVEALLVEGQPAEAAL